jgi:hypothetical protein
MACLKAYGGDPPKCECCGEANIGFLTLDHVNNDGHEHRKSAGEYTLFTWLARRGFPNDPPLVVRCYNCNLGRNNNGGECPHKVPYTAESVGPARRKKVDATVIERELF